MSAPEPLDTKSPIPCPKCTKLFRLPDGFTSANALACPHCQQQITGQEILNAVAPTATIVEGGTGRATRSFDEQDFVIPKPLKTATRGRSRHPERKSSGSPGSTSGSSSRSSGRSSGRSSSKKAEPSAVGEIFKIAFGGVLALPIAQLVLWWAFNADPIGLATPTSNVASFLVPPKLRPEKEIEEDVDNHNKDIPSSQKLHDDRVPISLTPN